ncbi:creatininase family protein [Actinomadura sp. 9N407]|uniref:creatininase family protein n=1 Tax=Actinomadura sp. 9N407 TaxID=3375154 RepID=UPI00379DFDFF
MTAYLLPLTTTDDEQDRNASVALLPVGSFEQHGSFLPLATDTVIACTIAREIAAVHPVMLLPPVTVSCSHEHAAWPGTVSISAVTLYAVVRDIAESLRRSGIAKLVLVNGHGGNYVLGNVVQEAGGDMALFPTEPDWEAARSGGGAGEPGRRRHARR